MIECMKSIGSTELDHELIFYNLYLKKYLVEDCEVIAADVNDNEFLLDLMYLRKNNTEDSKDFSKGIRDAFAFYVSNGIIKEIDLDSKNLPDLRVYINVEKLRAFDINSISKEDSSAKVLKKETKK